MLAVAAAILVVVLVSGSDDDPVAPLATGEPLPETAPVDPEYEALVAQLPAEITGCEPSTSSDPTATAAALCVAPNRPDVAAHFTLYSSPEAAQGAYDLVITAEGGTFDTGDCSTGVVGEEGWSGGGTSGRLLCNEAPNVQIFWSTAGSPILGLLNAQPGTPVTDLYQVWQSVPVY